MDGTASVGLQAALTEWKQLSPKPPNKKQLEVLQKAFPKDGSRIELLVMGGPGTGKSTLLKAISAGYLAEGKTKITFAEYNTQVKMLEETVGKGPRTRAGFFQMPEGERSIPEEMCALMAEDAQKQVKSADVMLEDEIFLCSPDRMDAVKATVEILRNSPERWGGLSTIKFGDPLQGSPIMPECEVERIPGSEVEPRKWLTTDGIWFDEAEITVVVLNEYVRCPDVRLIAGHREISYGPAAMGEAAETLRKLASRKVFPDNLYVHTAFGSNYGVMEKHNEKAWRRAQRRGHTVANGGVVHYKDEDAMKRHRSEPSKLKAIRGHGFEEHVLVRGELYLITVKQRDPLDVNAAVKAGRKFVTHMTPAELIRFGFDANGKLTKLHLRVQSDGRTNEVELSRKRVQVGAVYANVFELKPFYERFARLYQGLQFPEFEIDTRGFNFEAKGLLGMSLSRVTDLDGLKLTACGSFKRMQNLGKADWKVVIFMARYVDVPARALEWARSAEAVWLDSWQQYDRQMQV